MRIRLTFSILQPHSKMPSSFRHQFSSWINDRISSADTEFGRFLRKGGYEVADMRFKLFTFSGPEQQTSREGEDPQVSFVVSFLVEKAARDMLTGLFRDQQLRIGGRDSSVDLNVKAVEALPLPEWKKSKIRLRTTSPLLIQCFQQETGGSLRQTCLPPADSMYEHYFFKTLLDKHNAAMQNRLAHPVAREAPLRLRVLSDNPDEQPVCLEPGTTVTGYRFDFELEAPPELLRVGMLAGFGDWCYRGFGATDVVQ